MNRRRIITSWICGLGICLLSAGCTGSMSSLMPGSLAKARPVAPAVPAPRSEPIASQPAMNAAPDAQANPLSASLNNQPVAPAWMQAPAELTPPAASQSQAVSTAASDSSVTTDVSPAVALAMPFAQVSTIDTPTVTPSVTLASTSNQPATQRTIQVAIHNVQPGKGSVRVAAFTNPANFPNSAMRGLTTVAKADATSVSVTLPISQSALEQALQAGNDSVAVAVYQDINGDGQLNRSRSGIPSEPCAFSRGAMGRRGPPAFEEAAVPMEMSSSGNLANIEITLPGSGSQSGGGS